MKVFLDTYTLIEMNNENSNYKKYREAELVTLLENLAEMYYIISRDKGKDEAESNFRQFLIIGKVMPPGLIPLAMEFRLSNRKEKNFSYFDSFGYVYALENNMKFVTGDRAFRGMKNVEIAR